jgi:hypothetical protein
MYILWQFGIFCGHLPLPILWSLDIILWSGAKITKLVICHIFFPFWYDVLRKSGNPAVNVLMQSCSQHLTKQNDRKNL